MYKVLLQVCTPIYICTPAVLCVLVQYLPSYHVLVLSRSHGRS